jgi:hypothetical protein
VVAHLQGDAETPNSATFDVVGRWQLRWQVGQGGNGVAATVKDNRGGGQGFFMGLEPGSGSIERDGGCSCTLELIPDGAGYDVQVVDVEG